MGPNWGEEEGAGEGEEGRAKGVGEEWMVEGVRLNKGSGVEARLLERESEGEEETEEEEVEGAHRVVERGSESSPFRLEELEDHACDR